MTHQATPPVVAVAVSGGRDSTALLHATVRAARVLGVDVVALHVHHGLMPEADAWVSHLAKQCRRWRAAGWPVRWRHERLQGAPAPGDSVEAWARRERYAALQRMAEVEGAKLVLLAHHQRDQAETVLLQLLRGSGARGLAAMPRLAERGGLVWARPWLSQPERAIAHYVQRHRLAHIEDSSNRDPRFARSRLRHSVWPHLEAAFPGVATTLTGSARHASRAAQLQAEVAQADLGALLDAETRLQLKAWRALSAARQWFALQAWLQARVPGLSDATVDRLHRELQQAGQGSWPLDATRSLRLYRGLLNVVTGNSSSPPSAEHCLTASPPDEGALQRLAAWHGTIRWHRVTQGGLSVATLLEAEWRTRGASPSQFQRGPATVPRALKKQFQAAGVPAWARAAPLLCRADQLLWVAGLGVDARVVGAPPEPLWLPEWVPDEGGAG